jgi:ATP-dependent helicase/nuclease subunit A
MTLPSIPPALIAVQHQASDPAVSAWVSANAGAGKTHVLAQRVIRLLLNGTDPAKILCLTFTKAAAANMANRVFDTLGKWIALDDTKLAQEVRKTGAAKTDPRSLALARRLFAEALETPGGLKVQTIHGFCTRLLQQFPFEANVAARFAVLDDTQQHQMLEQAEMSVLLDAIGKPDSAAGRALATATLAASDRTFKDALRDAIKKRDAISNWTGGENGLARAAGELSAMLGLGAGDTAESVEAEFFQSTIIPASEWPSLIGILSTGLKSDTDHVARLKEASSGDIGARIDSYISIFCTQKMEPRARVVTDKIKKPHPELAARLEKEQQRILALLARRNAVVIRDRTLALLTIATAMMQRYQKEKERRGLLDYEDLIARTRDLLTNIDAAWVHYKLDLGIDHLLIDEAQDTSPDQWEIIKPLVAEFTAGAGARGNIKRSIFAVGDDKQSIFSFQGAQPAKFAELRSYFKGAHEKSEQAFHALEFKYSFRSVPAVVDAVDIVFKRPEAFAGLSGDEVPTAHAAVRGAAPGLVELWPLVSPEDRPEVDPWDAPFDTTSSTSPRVKLARRIALAVKTWIARGEAVGDGDKRHKVTPGDVLVLVRQRGPLFEAIIRALKNAGIAVAGADRLVLTEHIAVMDLLALADAILLPQDDLALATVLKSPLFGLTEDELFALAWDRKGTLRAALREKKPKLADEFEKLSSDARRLSPFAFYAELLGAGKARKLLLARLGNEAGDALDEFLNLALDYEAREVPSLQGFVSWLRTASASIKRDMEIARDEVRVMTVHGAKGLEAPVVILADTTTAPAGPAHHQPRLLTLPAQDAAPGTPDRLAWMPSKTNDVEVTAAARAAAQAAAEDEYRRLLYVGMTRAADRLIVCGAVGQKTMPAGCWYELVAQGFEASGELTQAPADYGTPANEEKPEDYIVRRFQKFTASPDAPAAAAPPAAQAASPQPWLGEDAPAEAKQTPITPSSDDAPAKILTAVSREARRAAMARGSFIHRLLQSLPDVAPDQRRARAETFLRNSATEFSDAEQQEMLTQAFAILDDARFAALFTPGSRGEVPIVGRIAMAGKLPVQVNGQIDRLAVTDSEVLIADYKTNRPPPRRLEDVPPSYLRQLALYRALLMKVYPAKHIRAALIWTDVPDLMELSDTVLDAAFAKFTSA